MGLDVARDHAPPGESDRQAFDGRAAAHGTRAGDARQRPDVVPRRAILQRRREHAHRASLDPPGLGVPRRLDPVHVPQSARERGDRRPLRLPAPRADHRPRDRPGTQVDAPRAGLRTGGGRRGPRPRGPPGHPPSEPRTGRPRARAHRPRVAGRRAADRPDPRRGERRLAGDAEPRDDGRRLLAAHVADPAAAAGADAMISWEERLRHIVAIVDKDRRLPLWMWLTTFLIATLGFLFLLGPALSSARYYSQYSWKWYDSSLRLYYAISAGLTSLILGLTFARVHYGEVHRGTIRSIILYPVDMNDIAIAKLLSSLIVAAALSTMLFFGIFGAFFLVGEWPIADFLVIHVTALAMSFLALAVGVFLAQAIAHMAGRMVVSPTALGAIFLLLSILTTESGLTFLGTQVALILKPASRGLTFAEYEAIRNVAQSLSVFSPHHVGARILGIAFGITGLWADLHVIVPIAALIFAGGYLLGKKLYLDIFIR